jgi:anti-sigma factor ChrR (cupin superfamily)
MELISGRIVIKDLFNIASRQKDLPWQPFRDGVEIVQLYGNPMVGPSAALLRYAPGAAVPAHVHTGYEHILILAGQQTDQHGPLGPGTLVINPAGSRHAVSNIMQCIILIIWERPVAFELRT